MWIKTQLRLTSFVVLVIMGFMILAVAWSLGKAQEARENGAIAAEMQRLVYEKAELRDEYLLRKEERARIQWSKNTKDFEELLQEANERLKGIPERAMMENIAREFHASVFLFSSLVDYRDAQKTSGSLHSSLGEQRLLSQIIVNAYELNTSIRRLQDWTSRTSEEAQRRTILLVMVLMSVSALVTVGNSFLINRVLTKRLEELRNGAHIMGAGNLDHRIPSTGNDELASLAGSINDMAGKLKESTTSVKDLEREITERKRAAEALKRSEERLKYVLEGSREGFWDWDMVTGEVKRNERWAEMLGYTLQEIEFTVNQWSDLIHPEDRAAAQKSIEDHIEGRTPVHEIEYRMLAKDGQVKWVLDRARIVQRDSQNRPIRMSGTHTDISERKKSEEEREQLEVRLRQAQKMEAIGTLAGGIAHDFNNILSPIFGYTEMALQQLPHPNPVAVDLEEVLKAAHRARNLVKQILVFSRQGQAHQRVPMDIGSTMKEALKLLRASLPTTIEIRQSIEEGTAMADATQMHQVLINLCTNAAHAMENGGTIDVSLTTTTLTEADLASLCIQDLRPGLYLRLRVADTGHGMSSGTLNRIFDPYFTTKEVGKGTGLGLSVVQGIVKRHEGAVLVHSEEGRGSMFEIYIPRIEAPVEALVEAKPTLPTGAERILFVDDEPMNTDMGTKILERLGYHVTARTDSVQALDLFRSNPDAFDLIITDYTMPQMTGIDLAGEILLIRPSMPIILCTGYSEKVTQKLAKETGIRELVMKPLEVRELAELTRKTLDAEIR